MSSNLTAANLSNADLKYAILSKSDWTCALLKEADLRDADLIGINPVDARMYGALYNSGTRAAERFNARQKSQMKYEE